MICVQCASQYLACWSATSVVKEEQCLPLLYSCNRQDWVPNHNPNRNNDTRFSCSYSHSDVYRPLECKFYFPPALCLHFLELCIFGFLDSLLLFLPGI